MAAAVGRVRGYVQPAAHPHLAAAATSPAAAVSGAAGKRLALLPGHPPAFHGTAQHSPRAARGEEQDPAASARLTMRSSGRETTSPSMQCATVIPSSPPGSREQGGALHPGICSLGGRLKAGARL